jgi:hypothetical protein
VCGCVGVFMYVGVRVGGCMGVHVCVWVCAWVLICVYHISSNFSYETSSEKFHHIEIKSLFLKSDELLEDMDEYLETCRSKLF